MQLASVRNHSAISSRTSGGAFRLGMVSPYCVRGPENGAGDGIRTHDFNLGKVALYP